MMPRLMLTALSLFCLAACQPGPHLDQAAEARRLLDTDKEFAALSMKAGASDAFRRFFAHDGRQLQPSGAPVVGNDAMAERLKGDFVLTWQPQEAEVAASGDMGWTWGRYQLRAEKNGPVTQIGTYLDVWYKQPDGSWRIHLENGNQAKP